MTPAIPSNNITPSPIPSSEKKITISPAHIHECRQLIVRTLFPTLEREERSALAMLSKDIQHLYMTEKVDSLNQKISDYFWMYCQFHAQRLTMPAYDALSIKLSFFPLCRSLTPTNDELDSASKKLREPSILEAFNEKMSFLLKCARERKQLFKQKMDQISLERSSILSTSREDDSSFFSRLASAASSVFHRLSSTAPEEEETLQQLQQRERCLQITLGLETESDAYDVLSIVGWDEHLLPDEKEIYISYTSAFHSVQKAKLRLAQAAITRLLILTAFYSKERFLQAPSLLFPDGYADFSTIENYFKEHPSEKIIRITTIVQDAYCRVNQMIFTPRETIGFAIKKGEKIAFFFEQYFPNSWNVEERHGDTRSSYNLYANTTIYALVTHCSRSHLPCEEEAMAYLSESNGFILGGRSLLSKIKEYVS